MSQERLSAPSLVGRDADLRAVLDLIGTCRLVTITGLGGMGKTSLAMQVRARTGAPMVDLSTISDGTGVAALVCNTLKVSEQSTRSSTDQLIRHLVASDELIILDNCEHVIDDVADLVALVTARCPRVRFLATSTERLGLDVEHIFDLQPLQLPEHGWTLAQVRRADACALFRSRVRQLRPDFEISSSNMAAVIDICRKLDGLPLALELAAARMSVLSAQELNERLCQRFAVLTKGSTRRPPRHQTLRALVEWSHEKCSDAERILWARLSVFGGSFRLAGAEAVAGFDEIDPADVLDLLDGLVSRSVLTVEYGDRVRYRQLATISAFGAEQLAERGETDACRARLFDFMLSATRELVEGWVGPNQASALEIWRREHGSMMSALAWAIEDPARHDAVAELLALLRYHWVTGGRLTDGRYWLERVLTSDHVDPVARGHAEWVTAWVCMLQGDWGAGGDHVLAAEEVDDARVRASARVQRGLFHMFRSELDQAIECYTGGIEDCLEQGDDGLAMSGMFQLGMAQSYAGHPEAALATVQRLIEMAERSGEQWNRAYGLWIRGLADWHRGALQEAARASRAALRIQLEFLDGICVAMVLLVLTRVQVKLGDEDGALRLARVSAAVWDRIGTTVDAFGAHVATEHAEYDPLVGRSERLQPMSIRAAVEAALGLCDRNPSAVPTSGEELSPREREVLAELGRGRSNRQIAETFVISQRTAEGHVARVLSKLGLKSRAEAASWYARHVLTSQDALVER